MISEVTIAFTTDAGGAADTNQASYVPPGRIVGLYADKGTLDATADVTLFVAGPGQNWEQVHAITDLAASAMYYPTVQSLFRGRLRVLVAQGGNVKSGTLTVYIERD